MALVQSQVVDLFSPDPFRDAELLQQANWVLTDEPEHDANDIEWELPATSAQCQIVMQEAVQWTKVSMILPSHPAPTLGHIRATWRELCSHRRCLPFISSALKTHSHVLASRRLPENGPPHRC